MPLSEVAWTNSPPYQNAATASPKGKFASKTNPAQTSWIIH